MDKPFHNIIYCLKIRKKQEIAPVTGTVGPVYSEWTRLSLEKGHHAKQFQLKDKNPIPPCTIIIKHWKIC